MLCAEPVPRPKALSILLPQHPSPASCGYLCAPLLAWELLRRRRRRAQRLAQKSCLVNVF